LIGALAKKSRDTLLAQCELVELALEEVLYKEGEVIRYVYFPTSSFISVLKTVDHHSSVEVGMIGNEGMSGSAAILDANFAPLKSLIQGGGKAWRVKVATFRKLLETQPALRQLMYRYVDVLMRQLAQTAACTRFHLVDQRLARWLLMTQDRAHADAFAVTQEFLAFMLGVRRVGVTKAASLLKSRKLIGYARGKMTILNRGRLEAAACSCYHADIETYRLGLGIG
jgi:CRP-like cAMP-binding protein